MTKACIECGLEKRITEFSLIEYELDEDDDSKIIGEIREEKCHNCYYDGTRADQKHLILREAYRNYLTFQQFVSDTGKDVITYSIPESDDPEAKWIPVSISFSDLEQALRRYNDGLRAQGTVLSKRKEEAFYFNVICDMLQREVGEQMGITTVSVGQYVNQACLQLAEYYYGEDTLNGHLPGDK